VWSDSYDRDFGDVLALQDEIAAGIARALQLTVAVSGGRSGRQLGNGDAYALYLRGLYALDRVHPEQLQQAQSDLEQALVLDPGFIPAGEALALTHILMGEDEAVPPRIAWEHARQAAQRVLKSDADSTTALAVMGWVHAFDEFDWRAADSALNRALALNPRNPVTLNLGGVVSQAAGRREEALQRINAAVAIDPLNSWAQQNLGFILCATGELDAAEAAFRKSVVISRLSDGNREQIAEIMLIRGRPDGALRELQEESSPDAKDLGLALVYFALGQQTESNAALARLIRVDADLWPFAIALVYAYRGATVDAFAWGEKAYTQRDNDMAVRIRTHPFFAHLRSDPRYGALLRKMNLPE